MVKLASFVPAAFCVLLSASGVFADKGQSGPDKATLLRNCISDAEYAGRRELDNCVAELGPNGQKYVAACQESQRIVEAEAKRVCNQKFSRKRGWPRNASEGLQKRDFDGTCATDQGTQYCIGQGLMASMARTIADIPCNDSNHGQQRCVGDKGFITCVYNQWTVEQRCGEGTRCQPHPSSASHVLCGW